LIVTAPAPTPTSSRSVGHERPAAGGSDSASNATLGIDPAAWELYGGNSTALGGTWLSTSVECNLTPLWYRWALPGSSLSGSLNGSNGSTTTFMADTGDTGRTLVELRSEAAIRCGSRSALDTALAFANVSVADPLTASDLTLSPAPLSPGEPAVLRAQVTGGVPPYTVRVNWTDGSVSNLVLAGPGPVSASHAFGPGYYRPTLTVVDSSGLDTRAALPVSIEVSASIAIGIDPHRTVADVGVPVAWNATVVRAGALSSVTAYCDGAVVLPLPPPNATSGFCTFSTPGRATISVGIGPLPLDPLVCVTAYVEVVPPPRVSVIGPSTPVDVGEGSFLVANLSGGVPPMTLIGAGPVFGHGVSISVDSDGSIALPLIAESAGLVPLSLVAVDAAGIASAPATCPVEIQPAIQDDIEVASGVNGSEASVSLLAGVTGGAPPYTWAVAPSVTAPGTSWSVGTLDGPGSFLWSTTLRVDGPIDLDVSLVDSAGAELISNATVTAAPWLSVNGSIADLGGGSTGQVRLTLGIAGGLPPYNITVSATSGARWNLTVRTDGTYGWPLALPLGGTVGLVVSVVDATGAERSVNGTVSLPVPPSAPSPPSDGSANLLALGLGLFGLGTAAVFWRLRRARPIQPPPSVDPVATLRSIIEPADGADRATVELLAEEAGVPAATAKSTLDRLIANGSVASESDPDGSEVLSWERDPTA
jgi:hypothetical protein